MPRVSTKLKADEPCSARAAPFVIAPAPIVFSGRGFWRRGCGQFAEIPQSKCSFDGSNLCDGIVEPVLAEHPMFQFLELLGELLECDFGIAAAPRLGDFFSRRAARAA
jgi:hypothetical protein